MRKIVIKCGERRRLWSERRPVIWRESMRMHQAMLKNNLEDIRNARNEEMVARGRNKGTLEVQARRELETSLHLSPKRLTATQHRLGMSSDHHNPVEGNDRTPETRHSRHISSRSDAVEFSCILYNDSCVVHKQRHCVNLVCCFVSTCP